MLILWLSALLKVQLILSDPPAPPPAAGGCRSNVTTRTFTGEPSGSYVLRSDRTKAPYAGKCPLDCLYKDLGWFSITLNATKRPTIASNQRIVRHGRASSGGSVWSQGTVTVQITAKRDKSQSTLSAVHVREKPILLKNVMI